MPLFSTANVLDTRDKPLSLVTLCVHSPNQFQVGDRLADLSIQRILLAHNILADAILRTDYAGQIAVLHCRSGTAQAICAAVDAKQDHRIVGTIAGDDTIFILLRSEEQAAFFAKQYAVWMQTEEGETIC